MNFERIGLVELCARIPYSPRTIYNLINKKVLINGVHYTKPRGKLIFRWEEMEKWIGAENQAPTKPVKNVHHPQPINLKQLITTKGTKTFINI